MHLLPDAQAWSRIHARVQAHVLSPPLTDHQSWKLLSVPFTSPAHSPSSLSLPCSPQPSACPWQEPCPLGSALEGDAVISKGADSQTQTTLSLEKAGRAEVGGDTPSPSLPF